MKAIVICSLFVIASFVVVLNVLGSDGFQGVIFFRNGDSVHFDHIGDLKSVYNGSIDGKLGSQNVSYSFSDLNEIVFADPNETYYYADSSRGTVIITNRQGQRFTITKAAIRTGEWCRIDYVYQDPVVRTVKETKAFIKNNISHIVIGEKIGDIKRNPKTGEYFPALYLYDPFTRERLDWATRK